MGPTGVRSGQSQSLSIYQLFPQQNRNALKLNITGGAWWGWGIFNAFISNYTQLGDYSPRHYDSRVYTQLTRADIMIMGKYFFLLTKLLKFIFLDKACNIEPMPRIRSKNDTSNL